MYYSNLFQYFYQCAMVPTLVENSLCAGLLTFFVNIIILTGEPAHTISEMEPCTPVIIQKIKYPLHFVVSYVQPVTQHVRSRTVQKAPLQSMHTKRNGAARPSYSNYCLKCELLRFLVGCVQLFTQQYESRTV